QAKDRLLVRISHELRQPLHTLLGWIDMLRKGAVDPDKLSAAYEVMDQTARSQDALLSQLLDLSRIRGGALRVDLQPVDVCALVESLIESLVPLSKRHEVTVKGDLQRPVRFAIADQKRRPHAPANLMRH